VPITNQLGTWQGAFGSAYTDRNTADPRHLVAAFRTMLGGLGVASVLEVGCNRGHNLTALHQLLAERSEVVGVEPNPYALSLAQALPHVGAVAGHAADLPFPDAAFDLVFTAGVLIHVPPVELDASLAEIHRVARRYVLAVEYFAEDDTPVAYRDLDEDHLWKRDFRAHYQRLFAELEVVRSGYWGREDGFDRCHWWLLEKPAGS